MKGFGSSWLARNTPDFQNKAYPFTCYVLWTVVDVVGEMWFEKSYFELKQLRSVS